MNWHQPEKLRLKRCWKGQISYLKNVPKVLNMFAGVRQKEVGDGQSPNAGNITAAHNEMNLTRPKTSTIFILDSGTDVFFVSKACKLSNRYVEMESKC